MRAGAALTAGALRVGACPRALRPPTLEDQELNSSSCARGSAAATDLRPRAAGPAPAYLCALDAPLWVMALSPLQAPLGAHTGQVLTVITEFAHRQWTHHCQLLRSLMP